MTQPFPDGFLWGTASSAYQTEGGNLNTDWYRMETEEMKLPPEKRRIKEPCGDACDSWNRYEEDFNLAAGLGLGIHRLSVEWSRVCPDEGKVDYAALERYRHMLRALKTRGINTMLCLHHFTVPLWIEKGGGFPARPFFMRHFSGYVETAVKALGDLVDYWLPINEPNVVPLGGYLTGLFPPYRRNPRAFIRVYRTFFHMHARSYRIIKDRFPSAPVGVAFAFMHFQPFDQGSALDRTAASLAHRTANTVFFDGVRTGRIGFPLGIGGTVPGLKGAMDFVGLNYYSTTYMRGPRPVTAREGDRTTDMGWIFHPQGIYDALGYLAGAMDLPIIVTENGVAATDESFRIEYMEAHLREVRRAIAEGVPVRGYMCWSLTDNFEWDRGYDMRFGLVHVDYATQRRTVKEGGRWFAEVIRKNSL